MAKIAKIAKKTDPKLWEKVKTKVIAGDKGGKPGQWSARKAQLATQGYKADGGGHEGGKSADNHLAKWTHEDWGTKSGAESRTTGGSYLPKTVRDHLSDAEYKRTTEKKRVDTAGGNNFRLNRSTLLKRPPGTAKPATAAAGRHC